LRCQGFHSFLHTLIISACVNKIVIYLRPNDSQNLTPNILTPRNLVGSLLKQFIQQSRTSHVSENIRLICTKHWEEELNTAVLCEILKTEIATFERVYLVIDALDQYPEKSQRWLTTDLLCMDQEKLSVMAFSGNLKSTQLQRFVATSANRAS